MSSKLPRRNRTKERQAKAASREPYSSDLSDEEWKLIAPLFAREKKTVAEDLREHRSAK